MSLILKNRNISMTTKFRVLKTYVWSTLTYGCEFWTITSDIEKKIEAAEMWFIRRMLRISWTEKKSNVNVLREGNVQRSLLKTITLLGRGKWNFWDMCVDVEAWNSYL